MYTKAYQRYYHFMLLPGMLFLLLFNIIPMFGIVMAFQNYVPAKGILGSQFIGLQNYKRFFLLPDARQIILNTLVIAVGKIVVGTLAAILFALMLNEVRSKKYKKTIQTVVYLPHFLSWVILAVMISNLLSYDGPLNMLISMLGGEKTLFLTSNRWFRKIVIGSEVWKEFGYNAIIYVAAMTAIDTSLYEAAKVDGANRLDQIRHITLPGIVPTIILMATLSFGNILNAGFEQIFNLYSPLVYETGDIIDTYVYRVGLENLQYSVGTAVGLFKSLISFLLMVLAYQLADKFAGYRIF